MWVGKAASVMLDYRFTRPTLSLEDELFDSLPPRPSPEKSPPPEERSVDVAGAASPVSLCSPAVDREPLKMLPFRCALRLRAEKKPLAPVFELPICRAEAIGVDSSFSISS